MFHEIPKDRQGFGTNRNRLTVFPELFVPHIETKRRKEYELNGFHALLRDDSTKIPPKFHENTPKVYGLHSSPLLGSRLDSKG
jgi:hypothetical protein